MNDTTEFCKLKQGLFDKYFAFLNNEQRKAVYQTEGPLLVLAGAGSGKTTVLVNRIANIILFGNAYHSKSVPQDAEALLERMKALQDSDDSEEIKKVLLCCAEKPAKPYNVVCVTFTNKAADEFKKRLSSLLGEQANDIWAGTFHSICVRILRRYIHLLGYDNSFTIYDSDDSRKLVTDIIKKQSISHITPKEAVNAISRLKERGILPEESKLSDYSDLREGLINEIYTRYQKELKSASAVDFDDIILLTNTLFDTQPEVAKRYQDRFDYVLADEYQDTNPSQSRLLNHFAGKKKNICVVGDDDQSIYGFRGATIKNILSFDQTYKDAKTIRLEQNYRSTGNILQAANSVIANNLGRKGKNLWTDAGDGELVQIKKQYTQSEEAAFIVNYIREAVLSGKYRFSDFAVLYRANALSNALEIIFSKSRIPYKIFGGVRFYERREIKDILAYLSVMENHADTIRLKRIINLPRRAIGATTVERVEEISVEKGISMFEVAEKSADYDELLRASSKLEGFTALIKDLADYSKTHKLSETVAQVIEQTGYLQMLREEEDDRDRENNVQELISSAQTFEETSEDPSLKAFLEELALVSDIDSYDSQADSVALMTIHSAKGLEFPCVFVAGFEEGIFPSLQAVEEGGIEEERRLAYVAITRAKRRLYLMHTNTRLLYGRTEQHSVSRFEAEIPEENKNCERQSDMPVASTGFGKRKYQTSQENFAKAVSTTVTLKKSDAPPTAEAFAVGTRIKHPFFGGGTIQQAQETGGDMLYEILFDSGQVKRLMGNYAKLKAGDEL